MDPLARMAHQRLEDLRAVADAIRLEREAATYRPSRPAEADLDRTPTLAVVAGETGAPCKPEAKAA